MKKLSLFMAILMVMATVLTTVVGCKDNNVVTPTKYTVTVVGGTGGGEFEKDSNCTVTATLTEGTTFGSWKDENGTEVSTSNPYTFKVTANVKLTAALNTINKYSVRVNFGTIDGETETEKDFYEGASVTVIAGNVSNKIFEKWTVGSEEVSTDSTYTFAVSEDIELTAVYRNPKTYTVSVVNGKISGATSKTLIEGVDSFDVTVVADTIADKTFTNWSVNGVEKSTDTSYSFTVTDNITVTANSRRTANYTVTVIGGTINDKSSRTFTEGVDTFNDVPPFTYDATVVATVANDEIFINWTIDSEVVSTNETYSFIVSDNVTVTANVRKLNVYTVTVDNGKIGGESSKTFTENTDVFEATVVATVAADEVFVNWTVGSTVVSTDTTYIFDVTASVTIKANVRKKINYTVTVVGGKIDGQATKVFVEGGSLEATVIADEVANSTFQYWSIDGENVSNNEEYTFTVTENVTITAIFKTDGLATLMIRGGDVSGDKYTAESSTETENVYKIYVDDEITLKADEAPAGKMFVGWDYKVKNSRAGNPGVDTLTFNMPDEAITVWAIYSDYTTKTMFTMTGGPDGFQSNWIQDGRDAIGTPQEKQMALPGYGYRMYIPATQTAMTNSPENLTKFSLDTVTYGSQTIKAMFYNEHATQSIDVELYASQCGNMATTGVVTVGPQKYVTVYFVANLGFYKPWMGFAVRSNVTCGEMVYLNFTFQCASTYPLGDKSLDVAEGAEYVRLGTDNAINKDVWKVGTTFFDGTTTNGTEKPVFGNDKLVYNPKGASIISHWAQPQNVTEGSYVYAPISNMPAYDASNPTTKIYLRMSNNIAQASGHAIHIGTSSNPDSVIVPNPTTGDNIVNGGYYLDGFDSVIVEIEIPRTADDNGVFYIFVVATKVVRDPALTNQGGQHITIQMLYNDKFDVSEQA